MQVCGFVGHRPEKLFKDTVYIKKMLSTKIDEAINESVCEFITCMERGVDLWAAQMVLQKKRQRPDLRLICAVPYVGVENHWSMAWRMIYNEVLEGADKILTYHSKNVSSVREGSYWMVENSERIIGVFNGTIGCSAKILEYAKRKNLIISVIEG